MKLPKIKLTPLTILFAIFSIVFFIYLIMPGPTSINDFPPVPNSVKSTLEGDTIHVPNVAGYFSDEYRPTVTQFYKEAYQKKTLFPFPPLKLNYPPEHAFIAIKDQTHSTYLEEYVYPFRESLFVNGMEPFYEDGESKYWGAAKFILPEGNKETKTTIRYYPSPLWSRLVTWLGINLVIIWLYLLTKKVLRKQ